MHTKEQLYFLKLMQPFLKLGCKVEFNPTRVITPEGTELYKEEKKS